MTIPEWTDVHYFLELARAGSLSAAAHRLGVEHTTVSRRMRRLEEALGATLFDRRREGHVLTEVGRDLLVHAETMEASMLAAGDQLLGASAGQARGAVRLNAPEVLGSLVIAPRLSGLLAAHPDLRVDLVLLPRFADLAAREAELAIVIEPPTSGRYMTARLCDYRYYLYGAPSYLAAHPPIVRREQLGEHSFVDYVQDQLMSARLDFFKELGVSPRRRFCCTGMTAQVSAAIAGLGLVMAPPYAVPADERLQRILPGELFVQRSFWLVAPSDLFRLRRIRAVWDYLRQMVEGEPHLFGV